MRPTTAAAFAMLLRCLGLLASVTLFGIIAIAPAAGQQGDDLNAVLKRFTELFAAGDYPAAYLPCDWYTRARLARVLATSGSLVLQGPFSLIASARL